jgi:glycosidase
MTTFAAATKVALTFCVAILGLQACANSAIAVPTPAPVSSAVPVTDFAARMPEDEVIYFLLVDRFANGDPTNDRAGTDSADPMVHGFDPTNPAFYNGGDLKGVIDNLDYLEGLGVTAIWMTPVFRNKWMQVGTRHTGAGYHGYWITDFLDIDPHLGTKDDYRALIEAAHARGIKVYMDIVVNHTADVVKYAEWHLPSGEQRPDAVNPRPDSSDRVPYKASYDYPWTRKGGIDGPVINQAFAAYPEDDPARFSQLEDRDYAYTPFIPAGEETVKNPAWLNEIWAYTNRGDSLFNGESSFYGDFVGLDDLLTEDPRVLQGLIEIYSYWIEEFGVDGFRIDTAKHVKPEFWHAFIPAIEAVARANGKPNFHQFGEVYAYEFDVLQSYQRASNLPAVIDFGFQNAAISTVLGGKPMSTFERLYNADILYGPQVRKGLNLPIFLGNHDMGRFGGFVRKMHPDMSDEEAFKRSRLAHAMMMFSRGAPVIYYGDEQGFASIGDYEASRESMFASRVPRYMTEDLIATDATPADDNFDTGHPLYRAISEMAAIRTANAPLRRGEQHVLHADPEGGLLALSRTYEGATVLVVFNADLQPRSMNLPVPTSLSAFQALAGICAPEVSAPGSYPVTIPALDFIVCKTGTTQ